MSGSSENTKIIDFAELIWRLDFIQIIQSSSRVQSLNRHRLRHRDMKNVDSLLWFRLNRKQQIIYWFMKWNPFINCPIDCQVSKLLYIIFSNTLLLGNRIKSYRPKICPNTGSDSKRLYSKCLDFDSEFVMRQLWRIEPSLRFKQ